MHYLYLTSSSLSQRTCLVKRSNASKGRMQFAKDCLLNWHCKFSFLNTSDISDESKV